MITSQSALDLPAGGSKLGLFTNQIVKFVILGLGCIFSIMIGVQVTDSDANGLATFVRYVAAGAFIAGVISPRLGIYLVLFMCPVLDLVKRMLILFNTINLFDVASVLAIAPVTMAGAVVGTLGSRIVFRRKAAVPGEGALFIIMLATTSLVTLSTVLHNVDSTFTMLKNLAEGCIYLSLILLIPVHFPKTEDVSRLLRWCIIVFAPVAIYGFWQKFAGLSDFEARYLASGLSIAAEDYLTSDRIFSTLNSNHSFSVTMACCSVIVLLQRHLPTTAKWQKFIKKRAWWLFILFATATLVSLRRTGWLVIFFSLAGAFCFRTRTRTLFFYFLCVTGVIYLIYNAEYIFTQLPAWEGQLEALVPGYDQAVHLQTFNDRLGSFQNLRENSGIWSYFGLSAEARAGLPIHDAMTETVVSYGFVGLAGFMIVLVTILSLSHRIVWRAGNAAERSYSALLLSFIFANLFVGAIMQSHIAIFPINFIFWVCAGALLKITFHQQEIEVISPKFDFNALSEALRTQGPGGSRLSLPGR